MALVTATERMPSMAVADMTAGVVFVDAEGRLLTVRRVLSLGDERARLETDKGVALVPLSARYPVALLP